MGCDIHSFVEYRDDGRWSVAPGVFVSDHRHDMPQGSEGFFSGREFFEARSPVDSRNYALFGFLANVRGRGPSCTQLLDGGPHLRGVPDDASDFVAAERAQWGAYGHSPHWLSLRELVSGSMAAAMHHPDYKYFSDQLKFSLDQLVEFADKRGLDHDDVRLVFWFDN